jgi:ABC-type Mn2+/Zn2+ transport system ATPase subunit
MRRTGAMIAAPLLAVEGLAAGYGGPPVLRDVGFTARPGDRIAVLGPNGGGKTTLFRALLGELRPAAGTLQRPPRIAVVPQTERSRLDFPVSALDVALMGALSTLPWWRRPGRPERARARAALADVGLADRAARTFGDLSGGQRQRVLVARALVQDAPVLLLDEPYVGLDGPSIELLDGLLAGLAQQGRALLIATHDVDQARGWDRVLCLNGRQVAYGDPATTLTRPVLEATYGADLVDVDCPQHGPERTILPAHHHEHRH